MQATEGGELANRRERASIAAQACQTCRQRKSKCDEQRPQCGLCRRLDVVCEYREPLPTKKDKTMVHILDALTRLENKFDNLTLTGGNGMTTISTPNGDSPGKISSISPASSSQPTGLSVLARDFTRPPLIRTPLAKVSSVQAPGIRQSFTVSHKILLWPTIYLYLVNLHSPASKDIQYIVEEGTAWFLKQEMLKNPMPLPSYPALAPYAIGTDSSGTNHASRVAFPALTDQLIQEYTDAYFNTFNILFPVLNRDTFINSIATTVVREGYGDEDAASIIALLVFSLGQAAVEGLFDRPISVIDGQPSGIRGGSADLPPGLHIFNEARRRFGFIATQTSLENVQIRLLMAIYFESHGRHLDFWHMIIAASMTCQVLIKCQSIDWSSGTGDLVKRAYWTCVLSEDLYHIDLDLPQSGIQTLEDEVPLPQFHDAEVYLEQNSSNEERSHFQYHFLAMITLRRLLNRITEAIHDATPPTELVEQWIGPPITVICEMTRQLDSWRALLPRPLQWSDQDRFDFPLFNSTSSRRPDGPLFSPDQGPVPIGHKYNLDIVTAQLRTRFYQTRFVMYQPFVFKALHFPEHMTPEDEDWCALALKSACMWPLALAPPKNKKRLVPHLFSWTQNFLGILLIFRMTSENDCLRKICDEKVDRAEMERSAGLMLDWIRDVRQIDGVADWSWKILKPVYLSRGMD